MRNRLSLFSSLILLFFFCGNAARSHAATTLEKVRTAGSLACGVDTEEPEYTLDDAHGNHAQFDIDICKAIAVSVLGSGAHFNIRPYRDEADSLKALKNGEIDVLATASPYIDNNNGSFRFARPIFYDYQGLLVNSDTGIRSARDLAGKKICFLIGTEIEWQIEAYMKRQSIPFIPGPFSEEGEMEVAFVTGHCSAVTADISQLAYERIAFKNMAPKFLILPDMVAKDPLAPAVRADDPQWAVVVDWVMNALIEAEEYGVTKANAAQLAAGDDEMVRRLLGAHKGYAQFIGLKDDWVLNTVESVGNYGEIFERDLGPKSPMRLDRGLNNLWKNGGLLMAEPIR
jgi:general L-amino acid transport system substrate-binding protein